jgi:hypothetical protein
MIAYLSLLVAVVGLLIYVLSNHARWMEIGRLAYACGLLAFLLQEAPKLVGLGVK